MEPSSIIIKSNDQNGCLSLSLETWVSVSSSKLYHNDGVYYKNPAFLFFFSWVSHSHNSGKQVVVIATDAAEQATGFCHCHGNKSNFHAEVPNINNVRTCPAALLNAVDQDDAYGILSNYSLAWLVLKKNWSPGSSSKNVSVKMRQAWWHLHNREVCVWHFYLFVCRYFQESRLVIWLGCVPAASIQGVQAGQRVPGV